VFQSTDGATWASAGTGFPTANVGRIALAVQQGHPDMVYAFVANTNGVVLGVYRLDGVGTAWRKINGPPDVLPAQNGHSQGDYDLAIAVDPADPNLIYLGGSYSNPPSPNTPDWPWPGSIWRCPVQASGANLTFKSPKLIGTHAHADVHVLVHTPGDPTELWCGCDGGVFLNRDPRGVGEFAGQNNGLSSLCCNFIAQHPTDPNVIYTGLQDNGTARCSGSPMWAHISGGDGGYCVVNWDDPKQVIAFANGTLYVSDSEGLPPGGWKLQWNFPWATMTQPIVTTPYNPGTPADAGQVAAGAGAQVSVSEDFANSWPNDLAFSIPGGSGSVFALTFARATRLFIGTTSGQVFQADRTAAGWGVKRLDNVAAGPLGLAGLITDVAVDWADSTLSSVYVSFGGALGPTGDRRRVWRFDGTRWEARSGPAGGNNLLNVEHNALVVDPAAPQNVYVGADIGVWHSADSGMNWTVLENGLPDAPVFDLQIHATQRLLRAATHGRGVYELPLS
jgi:hypothetical protein